MTRPYGAIAEIYDAWPLDARHAAIFDFVRRASAAPFAGRWLDVCCGTGTLAATAARRGFTVDGIDASADMLAVARRKIADAGVGDRVTLARGDASALRTERGAYDVVTCTNDSANYLAPSKLGRFVAAAARALRPGGLLVFDVNSPHKLATVFGNTVYAEARDERCLIWRNRLSASGRRITFQIDLFLPGRDAMWRRASETHVQYVHKPRDVRMAMRACAFRRIACRDGYSERPADARSLRLVFVGAKGGR